MHTALANPALPLGMTAWTFAFVLAAAFCAGWVDAVVGGGGLIQLPVLLLVPGITPLQALATNKLGSVAGAATSSITYYRRLKPDLGTALPMAAAAFAGSLAGAAVATRLPVHVFKPIIVAALVAVVSLTVARPHFGGKTALRFAGRRHLLAAGLVGVGVGFYDGLLGPGTGTFLLFGLVSMLGYAFLPASALAKIANFATNLGALALFVPYGAVLWGLGIPMAAANMAGGYLGARMAMARGNRFVRLAFLTIVGALIVKLGADVWQENLAPLFS